MSPSHTAHTVFFLTGGEMRCTIAKYRQPVTQSRCRAGPDHYAGGKTDSCLGGAGSVSPGTLSSLMDTYVMHDLVVVEAKLRLMEITRAIAVDRLVGSR